MIDAESYGSGELRRRSVAIVELSTPTRPKLAQDSTSAVEMPSIIKKRVTFKNIGNTNCQLT